MRDRLNAVRYGRFVDDHPIDDVLMPARNR
jgi:hypothetical protein